MELAHLTTILPALAAEPASIFYMVTGAVGLHLRPPPYRQPARKPTPSVAMLFCRKQTHDRLSKLNLV